MKTKAEEVRVVQTKRRREERKEGAKKEEKKKKKPKKRRKMKVKKITEEDLGWGEESSKTQRRDQEIGISEILQVDSCLWKESK